jgi:predicted DNA-binding protein YlxM (UPF0122 family)
MDNTPFVSHDPFVFGANEFTDFINKGVAMTAEIPKPPAVTNAAIKQRSKMGVKRLKEAEDELAIFKNYNSFLTPELSVVLMEKMLTSYKQSDSTETTLQALINKMWLHGDLAGIEVQVMLMLSEQLARIHAKLGNNDAIAAVNALEKLNRNRGGGEKQATVPTEKKP